MYMLFLVSLSLVFVGGMVASWSGFEPWLGTLCYVLGQDTSLSTQVYKWVPANCWGNLTNCGGVTWDGLASRPGEVEILLVASCWQLWTSWLQGFTFFSLFEPSFYSQ